MSLYLVSGKGGVGKTHLATSLAYQISQKGRKVLLVEFSHLSLYSEFFSRYVGFDGTSLGQNLFVSSWTGLDCLSEYVGSVAKSRKAANIFLKVPVLKSLIESAPGLKEISVLGKLTSDYRKEIGLKTDYDDIVFDAPSTGHFMSLLKVPFGLRKTVGVGPMHRQCESILKCLEHSDKVKFLIVKDKSAFSKKEAEELETFITKNFPERKDLVYLTNFLDTDSKFTDTGKNKNFEYAPSEMGWFISAKSLSQNFEGLINAH
jgi:anion-transporting  ArsA/GET3 family ATPase